MLTKRQKQILDFVNARIKKNGLSPTLEEIARHFRLSSLATVHEHLQELEKKGYIEKFSRQARAIQPRNPNERFVKIPLFGTIAAGQPIEAIPQTETIAVPQNKLKQSGEFFALRVTGNSMIDENINDGDVVLIKKQGIAENGQKVVALINNDEATLKIFYREKNQIRLQPANKNMRPIIIKKGQDFLIQGIVIDIIKNEEELQAKEITVQKTQIKKYDVLPLNKIICGDAVEELKKIPNESCDIIIIDPPYNIGKDFGNNIDKRELSEYINWCNGWIKECIRAMKSTATMFIYGFSEILAHLSVEIPINKRWLIWHYTNKNVASYNFWQRSHEAILCCWKDKPLFNRDEVREPYTEGFLNGAAGKIRRGTTGRYSKDGKETVYNAHENGALPRDVIKIPALAGGAGMIERWFLCETCDDVFEPRELKKHEGHKIIKHPTQKPLELSERLIKSAAPKENGIVLVPFAGSGSECVAAKKNNQNYIGIEMNPDYIKLAKKYIEKTKPSNKLPLF